MINRTLEHYEIETRLGEGGMGVVYKARDPRLNRYVAIKILAPRQNHKSRCHATLHQSGESGERPESPRHRHHSRHRAGRLNRLHRDGVDRRADRSTRALPLA